MCIAILLLAVPFTYIPDFFNLNKTLAPYGTQQKQQRIESNIISQFVPVQT